MQRRGLDDIYLVDGSGVSGERSPTLPHVPYSYSPTVPSFKKHKVDVGLAIQKVKLRLSIGLFTIRLNSEKP
jgi:hypothetical protein